MSFVRVRSAEGPEDTYLVDEEVLERFPADYVRVDPDVEAEAPEAPETSPSAVDGAPVSETTPNP